MSNDQSLLSRMFDDRMFNTEPDSDADVGDNDDNESQDPFQTNVDKNDLIKRMFSSQDAYETEQVFSKSTKEDRTSQFQDRSNLDQFIKHNEPNKIDVLNRMFTNTGNDDTDYNEAQLYTEINEIQSIDITIKEFNLKLNKLRKLRKQLEKNILLKLELLKKQGVKVNETNDVFYSCIKYTRKQNPCPEKSEQIQSFIKKNNFNLSPDQWREFSRLWTNSKTTQKEVVTLKKIKGK